MNKLLSYTYPNIRKDTKSEFNSISASASTIFSGILFRRRAFSDLQFLAICYLSIHPYVYNIYACWLSLFRGGFTQYRPPNQPNIVITCEHICKIACSNNPYLPCALKSRFFSYIYLIVYTFSLWFFFLNIYVFDRSTNLYRLYGWAAKVYLKM